MPLVVDTRTGRVRGRLDRGVTAFRGVPFARAPIGPLRLRAPAPAEPWSGVRECGEAGPAAPQLPSRFAAVFGERAEARAKTASRSTSGRRASRACRARCWCSCTAAASRKARPASRARAAAGSRAAATWSSCRCSTGWARSGSSRRTSACRTCARGSSGCATRSTRSAATRIRSPCTATARAPPPWRACSRCRARAALFQRAIVPSGRSTSTRASARRRAAHAFLRALDLGSGDEAKLAGLPVGTILGAQARAGGFRPVVDGESCRRRRSTRRRAASRRRCRSCRHRARRDAHLGLVDPSLAALRREDVPARLEPLGVARVAAEDGAALGARAGGERERPLPPRRDRAPLREPARRLADAHTARGAPVFQYRFELARPRPRRATPARFTASTCRSSSARGEWLRWAVSSTTSPMRSRWAGACATLDGVRAQRRPALAPAPALAALHRGGSLARRASADPDDPRVRERVVPADRVAAEEGQRLEGDEARQGAPEDLQQSRAPPSSATTRVRSPACRASGRTTPRARCSSSEGTRPRSSSETRSRLRSAATQLETAAENAGSRPDRPAGRRSAGRASRGARRDRGSARSSMLAGGA